MIEPTIEWVVEIGQPRVDATSNQVPADKSAASMPSASCPGWFTKASTETMLLRTVDVTSPPAIMAPANSNTPAITNATVMVIAPEPTAGPIALATSLAPMPHVIKSPNINARAISTGP